MGRRSITGLITNLPRCGRSDALICIGGSIFPFCSNKIEKWATIRDRNTKISKKNKKVGNTSTWDCINLGMRAEAAFQEGCHSPHQDLTFSMLTWLSKSQTYMWLACQSLTQGVTWTYLVNWSIKNKDRWDWDATHNCIKRGKPKRGEILRNNIVYSCCHIQTKGNHILQKMSNAKKYGKVVTPIVLRAKINNDERTDGVQYPPVTTVERIPAY